MFLLYGIIWEHPETDREYHQPYLCPIPSGISGCGFVWEIYIWETHGVDSAHPNKLWLDDYSYNMFVPFIFPENEGIYQNES